MAKSIMIQGTCSNAGKSLITTALCRIFKQDGFRTTPFKSQNMALNSFITADGFEIGRAQAMQAEAAGVPCDVRMNPVLLKPTSDTGSQVIVMGKPFKNMPAKDYYAFKNTLKPIIKEAYDSLASDYDIIVIEGAGSPAEINLTLDGNDIVNMGIAKMTDSPVLLVGDIDRGGVFASFYGTVKLLPEDEADLIKGFVINKFRGDPKLLEPAPQRIKELTGIDVLGVIPYCPLDIDDEDSLSEVIRNSKRDFLIDVAVIYLPHISNFTDFTPLSRIDGINVRYVKTAVEIGNPDLIILPGSKNTISDLLHIRGNGIEEIIKKYAENGGLVIGICGGYQMLGMNISDPENTEFSGENKTVSGMNLLPVNTVISGEKITRQVSGNLPEISGKFAPLSGLAYTGYEIHMGVTEINGDFPKNIFGSYIHGLFDKAEISAALAEILIKRKNISKEISTVDSDIYKEKQYDKLEDLVRSNLDMTKVYEAMGIILDK
jgi:adenosylcobyric acid synthase